MDISQITSPSACISLFCSLCVSSGITRAPTDFSFVLYGKTVAAKFGMSAITQPDWSSFSFKKGFMCGLNFKLPETFPAGLIPCGSQLIVFDLVKFFNMALFLNFGGKCKINYEPYLACGGESLGEFQTTWPLLLLGKHCSSCFFYLLESFNAKYQ